MQSGHLKAKMPLIYLFKNWSESSRDSLSQGLNLKRRARGLGILPECICVKIFSADTSYLGPSSGSVYLISLPNLLYLSISTASLVLKGFLVVQFVDCYLHS